MKHTIITGASSGIGKATSEFLAQNGMNLFLTARSEDNLSLLANQLREKHSNIEVHYKAGDVQNESDVIALYHEALSTFGKVDVLVANAGVGYLYDLEKTPLTAYDEMFDTNVKGVFLWLKAVLPDMKKSNTGQIVITSSTSGLQTWAQGGIYCATKHAIQGMVGALRKELTSTNIKVATINPGAVDTPWFDKYEGFNSPEFTREKMLQPLDVAKSIWFVLSQGSTSNIDRIVQTY